MARFSTKQLTKTYSKWGKGAYSTGYKKSYSSYSNSSFWMDDDFLEDDSTKLAANRVDYVKMAGYKRAIGNFVRIVTGKDNIPVNFSSGNDSYTDGKVVVISSKLDEKEFDSTVGLALHEGSHIALTDFNVLKVFTPGSAYVQSLVEFHKEAFNEDIDSYGSYEIIAKVKDLLNIIEDRRIDKFVYTSAPGYQGYYQALYDKYFNAKEIDKALVEGSKTEQTWDDYLFHICNFANPNRTLDALPGLRDVWNKINIHNINRLKTTSEAFLLAMEVYKMVMNQVGGIGKAKVQEQEQEQGQGGQGGDQGDSEINLDGTSSDEMGGMDPNLDQPMSGSGSSSSDGDADTQEADEDEKYTPKTPAEKKAEAEKRALDKAIQNQKDFLNGNIKKKKLSKSDAEKINAAAESNMAYEQVGGDIPNDTGNTYKGSVTNCMVVKGITQSVIDSNLIGSHCQDPIRVKEYMTRRDGGDYIAEGIVLGTMLGKRLKTRDEDRTLKTTRMETGRIDRRLIAELGFGNDRVFNQIIHNTITPSVIHISVDASGSMSGKKWAAAMKTSVAVAKAASMVSSLDCVISVRGSYGWGATGAPLMWVVYNSKKDKFDTIKNKLYAVQAAGSTPEGLCFQAVMKEVINDSNGKDAYFINISDGEPGYSDNNMSYGGEYALAHTAAQVNKMKKAGIKVLSYFVCEDLNSYYMPRAKEQFRRMYGSESEFIDSTNLTQLSASLNKLFVRK
jgi:hypothetical protein